MVGSYCMACTCGYMCGVKYVYQQFKHHFMAIFKRILLLFVLMLLILLTARTQTTDQFDYEGLFEIQKVIFQSPTHPSLDGWVYMRRDELSYYEPGENSYYTDPGSLTEFTAWKQNDNAIERHPVAYVSGYAPLVGCEIKVNCNTSFGEGPIYVKASNEDGYSLPAEAVSVEQNVIRYPNTHMEQVFPAGMVDYHEGLVLEWKIGPSEDAPEEEWIPIGETMHDIYVVHSQPDISFVSDPYVDTHAFHSLVHLGCTNADDKSTKDEIVDAIYSDFMPDSPGATPAVYAYGRPDPLIYWSRLPQHFPVPDICRTTFGLLSEGFGTCETFAKFFSDLLLVQGINSHQIMVIDWGYTANNEQAEGIGEDILAFFGSESEYVIGFPPDGSIPTNFLVKDWDVSESLFLLNESYYYPNGEMQEEITLPNGNVIEWRELDGVPGQGNTDPLSEFSNHAIIQYDDPETSSTPPYLYDPSYGAPKQPTLNHYENAAMAAFSCNLFYDKLLPNGMRERTVINWISRMNDVTPQLNSMLIGN